VAVSAVEPVGPFKLDAGTVIDWLMRMPVVGWFGYMGAHIASMLWSRLTSLDLGSLGLAEAADLAAQAMYVLFMLTIAAFALFRRRPVASSAGIMPKIIAFLGAFLLLGLSAFPTIEPSGTAAATTRNILSASLIAAGDLVGAYVMFHLGRSFSIMPEARRLVRGGPYRFVRHPLYLAEELAILGIWVRVASPWSFLLLVCHAWLQVERMKIEEGVLGQAFPDYADYAAGTARIIPGLY